MCGVWSSHPHLLLYHPINWQLGQQPASQTGDGCSGCLLLLPTCLSLLGFLLLQGSIKLKPPQKHTHKEHNPYTQDSLRNTHQQDGPRASEQSSQSSSAGHPQCPLLPPNCLLEPAHPMQGMWPHVGTHKQVHAPNSSLRNSTHQLCCPVHGFSIAAPLACSRETANLRQPALSLGFFCVCGVFLFLFSFFPLLSKEKFWLFNATV